MWIVSHLGTFPKEVHLFVRRVPVADIPEEESDAKEVSEHLSLSNKKFFLTILFFFSVYSSIFSGWFAVFKKKKRCWNNFIPPFQKWPVTKRLLLLRIQYQQILKIPLFRRMWIISRIIPIFNIAKYRCCLELWCRYVKWGSLPSWSIICGCTQVLDR